MSAATPPRTEVNRRAARRLGVVALLVSLIATTNVVAAQHSLRVVFIDGTEAAALWEGHADAQGVSLVYASRSTTVPWRDIDRLEFERPLLSADDRAVVYLADGGRLVARLCDGAKDAVVVESLLGDCRALPFDRLAGIELPATDRPQFAITTFESALAQRRAGEDVLVTRSRSGSRTMRGRLVSLGVDHGVFTMGGRERTFKFDRVFGVVLATGTARTQSYPVMLHLADGSQLAGVVRSATTKSLILDTSLGFEAAIPLDRIVAVYARSDRVVYVSDLVPLEQTIAGRLHKPWQVRTDSAVTGVPLTIRGQVFKKGLGVHSYTALVYDLAGQYESLAAVIGVDDAAGAPGTVVFRVLGDGERLFDSGLVTRQDQIRKITVDVSGVRKMTLEVDYGDALDLSDYADWADVRLIKPADTVELDSGIQ